VKAEIVDLSSYARTDRQRRPGDGVRRNVFHRGMAVMVFLNPSLKRCRPAIGAESRCGREYLAHGSREAVIEVLRSSAGVGDVDGARKGLPFTVAARIRAGGILEELDAIRSRGGVELEIRRHTPRIERRRGERSSAGR
jgi:hypothetical protein